MRAINKQDLIDYLRKSPENLNFNIFGKMLDDFRNTYEADEQIVNKIKGIITNIIDSGESISPEDDTITELVDLIAELLPEKMIIKPVGTLEITENGEYDVMNKAGVNVDVPLPSGTVSITQNGTTNVNDYEYANVNVVDLLGEFVKNNVTNFEIPEGVTSIGNKVFKNYTNLEEVTIPNSVTMLGNEAFSGCTNLTTVNGGFKVQNIGTNAFYNCPSILKRGTTQACKWAQYNGILTIDGNGKMSDYTYYSSSPTEWKNSTKVVINNGVTNIGNYAFPACKMTSITIPNSVTSIGDHAFWGCNDLTSITIPDSVTSIESSFLSCYGLISVTIGKGVTRIGDSTFYNCTGLTSVIIPKNVTEIGNQAFDDCTSLTDVYYTGTQAEWNNIFIHSTGNTPLTNATIHYNYTPSN